MYVTLEVGTPLLVRDLAGEFADDYLEEVIETARLRALEQNSGFISEFVTEFESRDPNALLSRYFRSDASNITRRSPNSEVQSYLDRKSTRLNSSHVAISYAVFCLKKKRSNIKRE